MIIVCTGEVIHLHICICHQLLLVVPHFLVLVIPVNMDMGHSTAMKVEESNAEEISNLFNMNTAFL